MKSKSESGFDRQKATQIRGVALVMLIIHHLFFFPSGNPWFTCILGNRWGGIEFFLSAVCKLCIPLFFFISGYGLWQSSCCEAHLWKKTLKRIYNIYIVYIVTALVTVLILSIMEGAWVLISTRHAVETFLGLNVAINGSWWFFIIYVELLLLTPLAVYLVRRFTWKPLLAISFLLYLVSPASGFPYFFKAAENLGLSSLLYKSFPINLFWYNQLYFCLGFCLSASGAFETVIKLSYKKLQHQSVRYTVGLGLIGIIISLRYFLLDIGELLGLVSKQGMDIYQYTSLSARADFILGPLLVFALILLLYQHRLRFLIYLGQHSAPIWLIHSTVIVIVIKLLKPGHPWSPLVLLLVLLLCCLYAFGYSVIRKYSKKFIP